MGYIDTKEHSQLIRAVLDAERERDATLVELKERAEAHDDASKDFDTLMHVFRTTSTRRRKFQGRLLEMKAQRDAALVELKERSIAHEVAKSMQDALGGIIASTFAELEPDVTDVEGPELPLVAKRVRAERDLARGRDAVKAELLRNWHWTRPPSDDGEMGTCVVCAESESDGDALGCALAAALEDE